MNTAFVEIRQCMRDGRILAAEGRCSCGCTVVRTFDMGSELGNPDECAGVLAGKLDDMLPCACDRSRPGDRLAVKYPGELPSELPGAVHFAREGFDRKLITKADFLLPAQTPTKKTG